MRILLLLTVLGTGHTSHAPPSGAGQTVNKNQPHCGQCYEDSKRDELGEECRDGWSREALSLMCGAWG